MRIEGSQGSMRGHLDDQRLLLLLRTLSLSTAAEWSWRASWHGALMLRRGGPDGVNGGISGVWGGYKAP